MLWEALNHAGPRGVTPRALAEATGRGRTRVHERLREHAAAGRATQVGYGRWAAVRSGYRSGPEHRAGPGRPGSRQTGPSSAVPDFIPPWDRVPV